MALRAEVAEHLEILEAALGVLDEGIAVLDGESRVLFWNAAAAEIAGYPGAELLARSLPAGFYELDAQHYAARHAGPELMGAGPSESSELVSLRHRRGHALPAMLRRTALRDALGRRFGTLLRFHPVEEIDALPHGESEADDGHETRLEKSQAEMEDRLDHAWRAWTADAIPFGVLWVKVDQAAMLRKTHGGDASEAMLAIVERTLLHGLRPTEILGRWGTNEFLILCHERTAAMLEAHAQHLGGLARTADFRWWGDRVSLTVSIGAASIGSAQSNSGSSLSCLLQQARQAMQASIAAGGNQAALQERSGTGGSECSQS